MIWLNIAVSVARSPEYIGSEPTQRSTWFSLMAYCAEQENGGVIRGCTEWKDRRWQQTAAVTQEEVNDTCDLFWFDGEDLHVAFYPVTREAQVAAGRAGGSKGGRPKKEAPEPSPKPLEKPSPKPEEKRREDMEGKRVNEQCDTPARGGLDPLVSKIKSLRPGWKSPAVLTAKERPIFEANREVFACFDDDDWLVQQEFLAARLPEGDPGWQPRSLIQYLDNPSDVMGHAKGWKAKQRPPVAPPRPAPNQTPEDKKALADFLNGGGFLKTQIK